MPSVSAMLWARASCLAIYASPSLEVCLWSDREKLGRKARAKLCSSDQASTQNLYMPNYSVAKPVATELLGPHGLAYLGSTHRARMVFSNTCALNDITYPTEPELLEQMS